MREIKFRAWNPETKKMFYDFDQNIKEVALGKSIHLFVYETGLAYKTLMQFTGLIDKNGKEVYEGDIIKWKETRFYTKEQLEKDIPMPKFFTSPVLFAEGSFVVNSTDILPENPEEYNTFLACFFNDCLGFKFDFKAEVIGNIYENPERSQALCLLRKNKPKH